MLSISHSPRSYQWTLEGCKARQFQNVERGTRRWSRKIDNCQVAFLLAQAMDKDCTSLTLSGRREEALVVCIGIGDNVLMRASRLIPPTSPRRSRWKVEKPLILDTSNSLNLLLICLANSRSCWCLILLIFPLFTLITRMMLVGVVCSLGARIVITVHFDIEQLSIKLNIARVDTHKW